MQQQSSKTEQHLIRQLTPDQLVLVAAWLLEEAALRAPEYSQETCETLKYIAHRLEILGKD